MKQQGDVTFRKVETIPAGCKKLVTNVLAEGEATGHAHRIETPIQVFSHRKTLTPSKPDFQLYEKNGTLYLHLEAEATVVHEEHKPVTLEPGDWEIGQVVEYDYINEAIERVRD